MQRLRQPMVTPAEVRSRPIRDVHFEPMPGEIEGRTRSLVALKPSGSAEPVFLVHGVFGQVFHFKRLAERVREDIPLYGLEARGLRDGGPTHASVPEMARAYIKEVRSVQPHGPYYVGGFSFGVHIGLEMASQLDAQGEEVRFLAIDAGPPESAAPPEPVKLNRVRRWSRRATYHWKNWRGLEGRGRKSYARETFRGEVQRGLRFLGMSDSGFIYRQTLKVGRRPERGHANVMRDALTAMDDWRYEPYPHRFTLFRAKLQDPTFAERPTLGFVSELAPGGVDVRHIPGSHAFVFVEPHVNTLTAEFEAWVDRQSAQRADDETATQVVGSRLGSPAPR